MNFKVHLQIVSILHKQVKSMTEIRSIYKSIIFFIIIFFIEFASAQNTNIDSLLTPTQWNALFPKRAGTYGVHPQGYTTDFYSFSNFKQAANELADYKVTIRKKTGVWGELTTVTRKSTNTTYTYIDVDPSWYTNSTPETVIIVDFKDFVNRTSSLNNKRELSAFLANISKETTGGWQTPVGGGTAGDYAQWGLYYVYELGYTPSNSAGAYSQASTEYPPNASKGYYGRGPIQLSWNYNYGQLSKFLFNDKNILLNNPDTIQKNGILAFKSAIWFWMMPQCPKPSCHQVMHDLWMPATGDYTASKMYKMGFAHTNNIINGGLECRSTSTAAYTIKVALRSDLYKYYLGIAGLSSTQINAENVGSYSSLCYESSSVAMQDYVNCAIVSCSATFSNQTKSICSNQSYFYNNQLLTLSGNYKDTFVNAKGCDSIETLQLTVLPVKNSQVNRSICQGDSLFFNTKYLKATGIYYDTLLSISGCDSIVTLNLSLLPTAQSSLNHSICQGDSFYFNNQFRKTAGTFLAKYTAKNGCDSMVSLMLKINPLPSVSIASTNNLLSATAGFSAYKWYFNNKALTISNNTLLADSTGTYLVEVTDSNGCKNKVFTNYTKPIASIHLQEVNPIEVFPIPSSGILIIRGLKSPERIRVYDALGVQCVEKIVDQAIDLSMLINGFYWLEIGDKQLKIQILH